MVALQNGCKSTVAELRVEPTAMNEDQSKRAEELAKELKDAGPNCGLPPSGLALELGA